MDKIWWSQVTNARLFCENVAATVLQGKNVILTLSGNVPWYDTMVEMIETILNRENPRNAMEQIECPVQEVGEFLMERYCRKEKRNSYRFGISYAAFLAQSEDIVLNDRYIWVRNIPSSKYKEWMDFIAEYNLKMIPSRVPAVFILENRDESVRISARKGFQKIDLAKEISAYDRFIFCALAAAAVPCKDYLKPYLADLTSSICAGDIELCALCVAEGDRFLADPEIVVHEKAEKSLRSDGTEFQFWGSGEGIQQKIWESQLKLVFPIVERYRNYFLKKYQRELSLGLPIKNAYGEIVDKLQDIEIGLLIYMVGSGKVKTDSDEYFSLVMFRDARNRVAHVEILSIQELNNVLSWGVEKAPIHFQKDNL